MHDVEVQAAGEFDGSSHSAETPELIWGMYMLASSLQPFLSAMDALKAW